MDAETACSKKSMPILLQILTIIMLIGYGLNLLAGIIMLSGPRPLLLISGKILIAITGIALTLGLRQGKFWAWLGIQIFWTISICLLLLASFFELKYVLLLIFVMIILILPWACLHCASIKDYCNARSLGDFLRK